MGHAPASKFKKEFLRYHISVAMSLKNTSLVKTAFVGVELLMTYRSIARTLSFKLNVEPHSYRDDPFVFRTWTLFTASKQRPIFNRIVIESKKAQLPSGFNPQLFNCEAYARPLWLPQPPRDQLYCVRCEHYVRLQHVTLINDHL